MIETNSKKILAYCREYLQKLFDPSKKNDSSFWDKLDIPHKGVYLSGVFENQNHRIGFMNETTGSLHESFDLTLSMMYEYMISNKMSDTNLKLFKLHITVISDVIYIQDPIAWDDKKDGIYFQWGQKYKAFYLPYEIYTMNMDKVQILNYLCSTVAKVPANLWRMPEGLVFKITCESFSE